MRLCQLRLAVPLLISGCANPADLEHALQKATEAIQNGQTEDGTWPTDYTPGTQFTEVAQQFDVWSPIILIDLLDPVAEAAGLTDAIARARIYSAAQIEDDGLVRYEGRGSALLPDSDDTALTWRLAPGDDLELIPGVLDVLEKYRAANGLYQIWLSPGGRTGHEAVGDDPNPADIQTQIHILQFLAIHAPEEARALCSALSTRVMDPDLWTYSELSTWLYIVREIDLAAMGFELPRPDALLQTSLEHQAPYQELVRLLRDLCLSPNPAALGDPIATLLERIAADDFQYVQATPLLLYHNDLTSTVSRFYWSREFAYALWVRLYLEARERIEGWPEPSSGR